VIEMKIDNLGDAVRFATYSSRMLDDPAGIAEELRRSAAEQGIEFDTIVGRGSSGMLIVPVVARILGKRWFIVRKDAEVRSSHDSSCKWMGDLGKRWIFLDDFCASGATFRKVRDGVKEAVEQATAPYQSWGPPQDDPSGRWDWRTYQRPEFSTELVGYFEYESRNEEGRKLIPWDENAVPGYGDYNDDTPYQIAQKAAAERFEATQDRAKGERLQQEADARAEAELPVTEPAPYRSVIGNCGPDCIVCNGDLDDVSDGVQIRSWGDVNPISKRYAMQMAAYTNPKSNMIVRGI
jgi:hypothetical protein